MKFMKKNITHLITIICFVVITAGFMLANIITPDGELSRSERRRLLQPPASSLEKLLSGEFFEKYELYFLDQFLLRDPFRGLKAFSTLFLFNQKENNGIYISDGYIIKIEYPLNEQSVINAAKKFNEVYERYLQGMNVYYSVIPDKHYFSPPGKGYLSLDYDKMIELLTGNTNHMSYIDLFHALTLADYYRTDIHWDQEKIIHIADLLLREMGNGARASDITYTRNILQPFRGSYYGQAALNITPDQLVYLTSRMLENAIVFDYETNTESPVYMPEKFANVDPYDVFLSGAKALLTIKNPEVRNGKELIIFRDSYGSSIAPLLVPGYEKITLIDLRYITTGLLGQYVEFSPGQDVLFLLGTQVINNSAMLR